MADLNDKKVVAEIAKEYASIEMTYDLDGSELARIYYNFSATLIKQAGYNPPSYEEFVLMVVGEKNNV